MNGILITGASGAFGTAFVRRLLERGAYQRIVIFSRGEYRQFQMKQELEPIIASWRLRFMIGDIRDRDRLRRAMNGVQHVVHAAALKRIEVGHYNPVEMVKTNIDGAINTIEAAQDAGVERVVALSSDKAWQPISPYGATKALAEALFIAANNTTGWSGPRFSCCRYGNVWGSTGSVAPLWKKMIAGGADTVPVTDPECTRFFMRMSEAVDLVLSTLAAMRGGEVAIPTLPAYRLGDLADAMGVKTRVTGLPAWEKLHEGMDFGKTSDAARRMMIGELKDAIKEI